MIVVVGRGVGFDYWSVRYIGVGALIFDLVGVVVNSVSVKVNFVPRINVIAIADVSGGWGGVFSGAGVSIRARC